jgi:hypothetical protein
MTRKCKYNDWEIGEEAHRPLPSKVVDFSSLIKGVAHQKVGNDCQDEIPQRK